jgi:hypothetical protein
MILIEGNCHHSRGQLLSPRCHQSYGLVTGVPSVLGIAVWNWIRCVKKKTLTILWGLMNMQGRLSYPDKCHRVVLTTDWYSTYVFHKGCILWTTELRSVSLMSVWFVLTVSSAGLQHGLDSSLLITNAVNLYRRREVKTGSHKKFLVCVWRMEIFRIPIIVCEEIFTWCFYKCWWQLSANTSLFGPWNFNF